MGVGYNKRRLVNLILDRIDPYNYTKQKLHNQDFLLLYDTIFSKECIFK